MTQPRHREPHPLGGDGLPFSKGLMARTLMAVGVSPVRAYELARRVDEDLSERGATAVDLERLGTLAVASLGEERGEDAMRRLRRYLELTELDLPVIVLVGGATGTGKSSVATELAYRLGITRVTSTDFIRQTMRAFFSQEFMPSIHYSSFEAGDGLLVPEDAEDPAIAGFLEQTRNVLVGVRASLDRALEEGWSMVLEGVHLVPGMLALPVAEALIVQCVLEIRDEKQHAGHFYVRDAASEGLRPVEKYLDRLPEIRRIQDEIVKRASRESVPVIETGTIEEALVEVMELVLASVERLEKVGDRG
jgi:2-phosphoglycerate kinase